MDRMTFNSFAYRRVAAASQIVQRLAAQCLRLRFPEGGLWKESSPPVGPFAPGAVYLQRQSGAAIVPMAVWMDKPRWPRRRYILEVGDPVYVPESLDLEAGASWLRERVLELHE